MTKLVHGGDIYTAMEAGTTEVLDYSANINPLGVPERVMAAAAGALGLCEHYPDPLCRKLRAAVAEKEAVAPEHLIFGNGAADLIFRLAAAIRPKKAMVLAPTFAEYEQALTINGCETIHYYLQEEDNFCLKEDFLTALDDSLEMLFLCNPNNPTGQLIPKDLLREIIRVCEANKIFLVVDECFIDFLDDPQGSTVKDLLKTHPCLFVLRAFTKNYAMPGLRLGYGLCSDERILELLFSAGQPWSVSLIAQEAGVQALQEDAYLEEARRLVFYQRIVLQQALASLGYKVFPPAANYIFFRLREAADLLYVDRFIPDLAKEGILIRSCANYRGIGRGYFRIAVRREKENCRLIDALRRREEKWQKQL